MLMAKEEKHVWRIVIIFTIVLFVGTYIYMHFFSFNPLAPKESSWNGSIYVNTALDLRFDLPEGWTIQDNAPIDAMSTDAAGEKALFVVNDSISDRLVVLAAQHAKGDPKEMAAEGASFFGEQVADATGYTVEVQEPMSIAGREWETAKINLLDRNACAYMLVAAYKDYIVSITVYGDVTANPVQCLENFSTVNN